MHHLESEIDRSQKFGMLKRQWGFTYTLMKGKENVLSEVNLIMMCYNLRRVMSILDKNDLKRRLKDLIPDFLKQMERNKAFLSWFYNLKRPDIIFTD